MMYLAWKKHRREHFEFLEVGYLCRIMLNGWRSFSVDYKMEYA